MGSNIGERMSPIMKATRSEGKSPSSLDYHPPPISFNWGDRDSAPSGFDFDSGIQSQCQEILGDSHQLDNIHDPDVIIEFEEIDDEDDCGMHNNLLDQRNQNKSPALNSYTSHVGFGPRPPSAVEAVIDWDDIAEAVDVIPKPRQWQAAQGQLKNFDLEKDFPPL